MSTKATSTKAPKAEPLDQVKFLVNCIKYATNGRPDFDAVAKDLGIVSKAAAQKRYERMLKSNGVSAKAAPVSNEEKPAPTPPKKRKAVGRTPASKKKAKKEESDEDTKPTGGDMKKEESDSALSDAPESTGEPEDDE